MRSVRFVPAAFLTWAASAAAQAPGPAAEPSAPAAPAAPAPAAAQPGSTSTTTTYVPFGVPSPGTDINAGLPSSSRPINGEQGDSFDLGPTPGSGATVYGGKGATAVLGNEQRALSVPNVHLVQKGDTLSHIAQKHYGKASKYMKIFEANRPMLKDPDKIYPGQSLRIPPEA